MNDDIETKARLLSNFMLFHKVFFELRTGVKCLSSEPLSRPAREILIARELTRVMNREIKRLMIHVPPRYHKTESLISFVAWTFARFPDSNVLYVSYSHNLATKATSEIKRLMQMPLYRQLFGVELRKDSTAKDHFMTSDGGSVYAAGAGGTITGMGAGRLGVDRFAGLAILDDMHKPDEATSDVIRCGTNDWYYNTMISRVNDPANTPIVFIGQRVHEDDLAARLAATGEWEILSLPALDVNNNALDPRLHTTEMLLKIKELTPYVFAAQYQQDPLPPGGAVFKEEWFVLTDDNPEIIATFITCDTAETDKSYNDATVFSFWGVYKIKHGNMDSGVLGLHWLDCVEIRVEPYQLESEFMSFYSACMRFSVKPKLVGIERKSTGTTLVSVLKQYQGLRIVPIERNSASGSKAQRFMEIQQYIASRQVSLTRGAKHTKHCVDHMTKITQNNAHRFDDIADTCADACRMVFIDKVVQGNIIGETEQNALVDKLMQKHRGLSQAYTKRWG